MPCLALSFINQYYLVFALQRRNKSGSECCILVFEAWQTEMITCGVRMGPVGINPAQLLIFYEACSESRYTDPLDFRGATLAHVNLKTEFQRFAKASLPSDHPVLFF